MASLIRKWDRARGQRGIDEALKTLYRDEDIDPLALVLGAEDFCYVCCCIFRSIPGAGADTHITILVNQATGRLMDLAQDSTLSKGSLKVIYDMKGEERGRSARTN